MSARWLLVATAALFSTGGAAIKLASLPAWPIAGLRSGIAALVLLGLSAEARRTSARAWLVGCAYAATMVLFVLANRLTTAADAAFLQGSSPFYVVLLAPLLLKEPVRRGDLVTLLVMGLGLAAFFVDSADAQETAPRPLLGDVLACVLGLTWAWTVIGLRWMSRAGEPALAAVVSGNVLAALAALPLALPSLAAEGLTVLDALVCLWLGVFQIALAYLCLGRGLRRVPALEASLILLLEPVLSPLWAWLLHGELPGPWAWVGGALLVLATAWRAARVTSRGPSRPAS